MRSRLLSAFTLAVLGRPLSVRRQTFQGWARSARDRPRCVCIWLSYRLNFHYDSSNAAFLLVVLMMTFLAPSYLIGNLVGHGLAAALLTAALTSRPRPALRARQSLQKRVRFTRPLAATALAVSCLSLPQAMAADRESHSARTGCELRRSAPTYARASLAGPIGVAVSTSGDLTAVPFGQLRAGRRVKILWIARVRDNPPAKRTAIHYGSSTIGSIDGPPGPSLVDLPNVAGCLLVRVAWAGHSELLYLPVAGS